MLCCAVLCAGASGSLPKALAEVVRPAAVAAYQEALASVLTSGAVAKKKQKEDTLKRLEESFVLLQLYANGADLLQVCVCVWVGGLVWVGGCLDRVLTGNTSVCSWAGWLSGGAAALHAVCVTSLL